MKNLDEFKRELEVLISKHCLESLHEANIPGFILADVAVTAMSTFCKSHKAVCDWYSVVLAPANSHFLGRERW
jgi:hypothetical protein